MANQDTTMQCKGLLGDCKGVSIDPKAKTVAFDMGGEQPLQVEYGDLIAVELRADGNSNLSGSRIWHDQDWFELRRAAARKYFSPDAEFPNNLKSIDRVYVCVATSRLEQPLVDLVFLHKARPLLLNDPEVANALKQAELWASRLRLCAKKASQSL